MNLSSRGVSNDQHIFLVFWKWWRLFLYILFKRGTPGLHSLFCWFQVIWGQIPVLEMEKNQLMQLGYVRSAWFYCMCVHNDIMFYRIPKQRNNVQVIDYLPLPKATPMSHFFRNEREEIIWSLPDLYHKSAQDGSSWQTWELSICLFDGHYHCVCWCRGVLWNSL